MFRGASLRGNCARFEGKLSTAAQPKSVPSLKGLVNVSHLNPGLTSWAILVPPCGLGSGQLWRPGRNATLLEVISQIVLYQGTASAVPQWVNNELGFSP
jgi:hypothetical protein